MRDDMIHFRLGTERPDYIPAPAAPTSTPVATVAARQSRDDARHGIDLLLAEDAKRTPAFATARRAAVMATCERHPRTSRANAADTIAACHYYEGLRGGGRTPRREAIDWAESDVEAGAFAAYERARGMR